ncbi:MAG: exopolyphosphatase, partial [Candidatus Nanopelagicales bacterium]
TVRAPFGRLVGARSGDKGGNVNIGLWVRHDLPDRLGAYQWLRDEISVGHFQRLLPESASHVVERYEFTNLLAVNFVIRGLLGRGVSGTSFLDPQGKGLGEFVRARLVDIPLSLLGTEPP